MMIKSKSSCRDEIIDFYYSTIRTFSVYQFYLRAIESEFKILGDLSDWNLTIKVVRIFRNLFLICFFKDSHQLAKYSPLLWCSIWQRQRMGTRVSKIHEWNKSKRKIEFAESSQCHSKTMDFEEVCWLYGESVAGKASNILVLFNFINLASVPNYYTSDFIFHFSLSCLGYKLDSEVPKKVV